LSEAEYDRLAKQYSSLSHKDTTSREGKMRFRAEIAAIAKDGATAVAMQAYEELQKSVGISNARSSYENNRKANQDVSIGIMNPDGGLLLDAMKLDKVAGGSVDAIAAAKLALHAATMTVTDGATYDQQVQERMDAQEKMAGLDLKTKQSLAKTGGVIGEQAGEQVMLQKRWAAGAKGTHSRPGDGEAGSLAGVLGLSLGRKDMKALKGMSQQEMVHSLLDKSGLGADGGKIEQDLMKAMAEKNEGLKALKVNQVLGSQDVREKLESNRNKAAENADPTYKLLSQHVPEQTKYLKLIVNSNEKSAAALAQMEHGDPEKPDVNMSGG
jgi:hypothetical protein